MFQLYYVVYMQIHTCLASYWTVEGFSVKTVWKQKHTISFVAAWLKKCPEYCVVYLETVFCSSFFSFYLMDLLLCHYSQCSVLVYPQSIHPIWLDWRPSFAMQPCKAEALKYHTDLDAAFWFIFPWHPVLRWNFSIGRHPTDMLVQ